MERYPTPAELTSLEETMRTLMDEELVHHDIINMSTSRGDHHPQHVCIGKMQRHIRKGRQSAQSKVRKVALCGCPTTSQVDHSVKKAKGKFKHLFRVSHANSTMDRLPSQQNPPHGDGKSGFQETARCHRASLPFQGVTRDSKPSTQSTLLEITPMSFCCRKIEARWSDGLIIHATNTR